MNDQTFNTLSKEELYDGFLLCSKNANTHFEVAQLSTRKNIFSLANSHLVLAGEESIKAIILFIKFITFDEKFEIFHEDIMNDIFSDHRTKHFIAEANYKTFEKMLEICLKKLYEAANTKKKQEKIKIPPADWWNQANNKKNNGFYVDFKNRKWLTPENITEKDYNESRPIISQLLALNLLLQKMFDKD